MGKVYLVGAGPGDPGLLTLRAAELLSGSDCVVYDALVNPIMLEHVPAGVPLHYVGKRGGEPSMSQEAILRLITELATNHEHVVRLKGGDPFVFGRGGEEAVALQAAGVPFEVVPGITAGVAAPAYAGIPVTHRGASTHVTFVTGHEDPKKAYSEIDWSRLAMSGGTIVVYMGVSRMAENLQLIIDGGLASTTPAAVIEWGTYPTQRTVTGTLQTLPALALEAKIGAPAIVVIGAVVELRERIGWFEKRPLFGCRILVTRARAQASGLAAELEEMGAEVIRFPTIRITPPSDPSPFERAVRALESYDWIIFTSVNGVERFWDELRRSGQDARALAKLSVCAIGPATAAALEAGGVIADLMPAETVAESVVEAMNSSGRLDGARILFPRAEVGREVLPASLRSFGAAVSEVAAYRTVADATESDAVAKRLSDGTIDLITFTSSSTVRHFVDAVGTDLGGALVASIGPITSRTAREAGLSVNVEAAEYSVPGLVAAVVARFGAAPLR